MWLMDAQLASSGGMLDDVAVWVGGGIVLAVFIGLVWSVIRRNRLK